MLIFIKAMFFSIFMRKFLFPSKVSIIATIYTKHDFVFAVFLSMLYYELQHRVLIDGFIDMGTCNYL